MIGPRPGCKNQFMASIIATIPPAIKVAVPNTVQKVLRVPPITEAQKMPLASARRNKPFSGTFGSRKKLLNEIARYCLSNTATQKIGSENIKNDTNVIE